MWLPEAWEQYKAAREALANTTGSTEVIFSAQSSGCKTSESEKQAVLEKSALKKSESDKKRQGRRSLTNELCLKKSESYK